MLVPREANMLNRHPATGVALIISRVVALLTLCLASGLASPYQAAHALTIEATNTINTGNCIPFGCPGTYGPSMGFTYQNVPAFSVGTGSTISFDTALPNDVPLTFSIYLGTATTNGGTTLGAGGLTLIVASGTPSNPVGNSAIGDYDLVYSVTSAFSFGGGGLVIAFVPSGPTASDNTGPFNLVGTDSASDPSGFFVGRFYAAALPVPSSSVVFDTGDIGNFRIDEELAPVPEPFSLLLWGTTAAGLGLARWRQRRAL